MPGAYDRDLIGYGASPPDPQWPGGARLAVNFVMNYEEGSEPSLQDGEGFSEVRHTEAPDAVVKAATSLPRACLSTAAASASGG
jgi:hypothetical protein